MNLMTHFKTAAVASFVGALFVASAVHASAYSDFTDTFDALLKAHTGATKADGIAFTGVNYDAWQQDARHAEALAAIKQVDIKTLSKVEQKTFWINAYNFLTIDLINANNERESIRNLGSTFSGPWKKFKWNINGTERTLNEIEHEILRKLGDERIHFAINCASLSCPDLLGIAYRADTLDAQLAQQEKYTLSETTKGVKIDGNVVMISKIFKWFDDDFNKGDIKGWLKEHVANYPDNAKIKYFDYSWKLNQL